MKRNFKLLVLTLVALLAMTLGIAFNALAEKPTNTDTLTVYDSWWTNDGGGTETNFANNKFTISESGQTAAEFANRPSAHADKSENRYKFTFTISKVDDSADYYLTFDARGHGDAPWALKDNSVWVRLHKANFAFCNENMNYAEGVNLTDGNSHELEIIIDDDNKSATLWIDDAKYTKQLTEINANGQFGFFVNQCDVVIDSPSYGYTATSVNVSQADSKNTVKMTETLALTATIKPAAATTAVTWSSSNPAVATVDNNGVVTGVAEGNVTITAQTATGVKGTYDVIVASNIVKPTSITLNETNVTLSKTQTLQLTATVSPDDVTDKGVTWSSSNENVATVENGLVTVVASSGSVSVTATCAGDSTVTATCVINAAPLNATAVSASDIKLEVGDVKTFAYTVTPVAADDEFTVTVNDTSKATYENGKLTALAEGTTTVTVTSNVNSEITATATITIVVPTAPDGMPTFDANKELTYILGCDPKVIDTLTSNGNNYVLDNLGKMEVYFPMAGDVPATNYSMNAIQFGLKVNETTTSDWVAAVLFRTALPSTAFYSNPSGIEFRIYKDRTEIHVHYDKDAKTKKLATVTDVNTADGLTHYFAMEVIGTEITAWIDGVKVVDGSDESEVFGTYFNVENNNSFQIMLLNTKLTVSDLHIYNTQKVDKYNVSVSKTGSGTVTGVPESAVEKDTAITVTVTAAEGWKVKSVKVNGNDATLADGKLSITITETTSISVEFEEIVNDNQGDNQGGNQTGGDNKDDTTEKSGCGGFVAFSSSIAALATLGGACLMLKKKNK